MPRSMTATSVRRPSARSWSRPSAKPARTKRVAHGTSAASSAKRSSATGSRSIATSVPVGPRRSATSFACPPAPNVQSTAVSPSRGSTVASSSAARTGTCIAVISASMAHPAADLADVGDELAALAVPLRAVPDLDAVARADDLHVLGEAGVLQEEGRDTDATGAVELGVLRRRGVEALELLALLGQRVEGLEDGAGELVVVLRLPQHDARLRALRHHDPLAERRAEAGRDGEAVLGIEGVVVGAAEGGHCVCLEGGCEPRWRSGRSPSTPVRVGEGTPLSPTPQPGLHLSSHQCPLQRARMGQKTPMNTGW